ncbi:MAG TPA: isoleucine--tRNA ligase [Kofleriaceae bacterium]|nr:isoleucine--tRNA ligase [Kofleriaceae bacterium]
MSLQEVSNTVRFADLELAVLARGERERTFQRSIERRAGAPRFVFYDGPPFATGLPHYGHILTSFIKDVVPRYQTMRGYCVPRRWGWDCHGLPVELEAERALGLTSPAAIAEHGIGPFNATCRALVTRYTAEWQAVMARLGRWVDFEQAYRTMDPGYLESVVWCFHALHQRGLVYEGEKVVPYCTRCQTALSNFETRLDDAYRPRVDTAATVAFALAPREAVLAWTTTPWTLPANAALAVHPELVYARLERDGDSVWLADAARERYAAELAGYAVRETAPGRALVGRRYQAAFDAFPGERRVVAAEWVSAADGTGAVHLAPAFGEDDQATCAALGITGENPVRDDGTFDHRLGELAGVHVFEAGEPILAALARAGRLFARAPHRHDYPHCWRCDAPLIYRSVPSWFVRVTAFKDRLVAHNREIRWVPAHVGDKRFADWLAGARDWAVSRHRFWGAPVPVWRCDRCRATEVIGSAAELAARGCAVVDWHRPAIDGVTWPCGCGGTHRRVPDVLDCWFESGAMPFAQDHYPFAGPSAQSADQAGAPAGFPGDFIVEYVAQTRGWFYTLLVLSTALFDAPPFRHAVCHGVLLGEDGRKMSKRLRNYPDPTELVAEHGSDALRAALLMSGAVSGNDIRFLGASVKDAVRRLHLPLWNVLHLYTAYALADGFVPTGASEPGRLERALASETELLRVELEAAMAGYDFARAYAALEDFITALSTWYLRLLKPSLWRPELDAAKRASYEALHAALAQLARLAAPFLPLLAEQIHAALGGTDSVHLEDWPAPRDELRDDALVAEMRQLREVVRIARRVREQAGVKHRQPLRAARVAGLGATLAANRELLAAELNVKAVHELTDVASVVAAELVLDYARLGKRLRDRVKPVAAAVRRGEVRALPDGRFEAAGELLAADEVSRRFVARGAAAAAEGGLVVTLDLTVDDALAREGLARELNRAVQDLRKQARLAYADRVVVGVTGASDAVDRMLADHAAWLGEQALATVTRTQLADPLGSAVLEVGDAAVEVSIARGITS